MILGKPHICFDKINVSLWWLEFFYAILLIWCFMSQLRWLLWLFSVLWLRFWWHSWFSLWLLPLKWIVWFFAHHWLLVEWRSWFFWTYDLLILFHEINSLLKNLFAVLLMRSKKCISLTAVMRLIKLVFEEHWIVL